MLDLDCHSFSRLFQHSLVDLTQACRGERFGCELGEHVLQFLAELKFNDGPDVSKVGLRRLHQHGLEGLDVLWRHKLVQLAHHLPQFDVRAAVLAEAVVHSCRRDMVRLGRDSVPLHGFEVVSCHGEAGSGTASSSDHRVHQLPRVLAELWVLVGRERCSSDHDCTVELESLR